jgi:hypothetical protein
MVCATTIAAPRNQAMCVSLYHALCSLGLRPQPRSLLHEMSVQVHVLMIVTYFHDLFHVICPPPCAMFPDSGKSVAPILCLTRLLELWSSSAISEKTHHLRPFLPVVIIPMRPHPIDVIQGHT